MAALLLVLLCAAAAAWNLPLPRDSPPAGRWEGYVLHLTATLRAHQLSSLHFLCRSRCVSASTLRRLEKQLTVTYSVSVGGDVLSTWPVTTRNLFVLVAMDCAALAQVTLHERDVVVLVALQTQEVFLSRAATAFESCWRLDILNVVAVSAGSGALKVHTYLPYHPGQCHDLRPRLAAAWTPRSPHTRAALGLIDKVRNLGGCPLRVTVLQARPWTDLIRDNNGTVLNVRGTYASFLFVLAKHLNFTPELVLPSDGTMYGNPLDFPSFGGALGDVYSNRSDVALVFSPSNLMMPYHGRPPTAQTTCTTWCLPTGYRQSWLWRPVVGEFNFLTWMAVLFSYVAAAVSHRVLCKSDCLVRSMLIALQGLLSSLGTTPSDWSSRSFLFCWSFSGLVLATLYMAALHAIHSSETVDTFFRTLGELADSPLPLYASSDHLRDLRKAQFDTAGEKTVIGRVVMFEYDKAVPMFLKFFARPDFGILTDRNACQKYAVLFTPPKKAPRFHVIRNYCLVISMANNLVLRRRSPLLQRLSQATSRLDEAGLTMHWFDVKAHPVVPSPDPVMRFRQLRPFLRVLGIGHAAATVAFLLEVIIANIFQCWCPVARPEPSVRKEVGGSDKKDLENEFQVVRRCIRLEMDRLSTTRSVHWHDGNIY